MNSNQKYFLHLGLSFVILHFVNCERQKETQIVLDHARSYLKNLEAAIGLVFPAVDRLGESYKPIEEALQNSNDEEVKNYVKEKENYTPYYTQIQNMVNSGGKQVFDVLRQKEDEFETIGDYLDEGFLLIKEQLKATGCTDDHIRAFTFNLNRNLSMALTEISFTQSFYNIVVDIIPQTLFFSFPQAIQQALYRSDHQLDAVKRVELKQMAADKTVYRKAVDDAVWIVNGFTLYSYDSTRKRLEMTMDKAVVLAGKDKCGKNKAKPKVTTTKSPKEK